MSGSAARMWRAVLGAAVGAALLAPPASATVKATECEGADTEITAQTRVELERTLLCMTNVFRAENGLGPLTMDERLRRAARSHSEDVGTYNLTSASNHPDAHPDPDDPSHTPGNPHFNPFVPGKYTPQDRADLAGYQGGVGENIAWSNFPVWTPMDLIEGWKESRGHRQNLLHAGYVTAGMGLAMSNGVTGTQMFGLADNGATDTAADLLTNPACRGAKSSVASAQAKADKARDRVENAGSKARKRRAKRKLRKAKKELVELQAAVASTCDLTY